MEEPWHEQLNERRIGIKLETVIAHELNQRLMYCQRAVGFSGETQHFSRITIDQRTQPAPGKISGRGCLNKCCIETAVLIFLAATARAGIVATKFHLSVFRMAFMDYEDLDSIVLNHQLHASRRACSCHHQARSQSRC